MPASMMGDDSGGKPKAMGSNMAMVATGPSPAEDRADQSNRRGFAGSSRRKGRAAGSRRYPSLLLAAQNGQERITDQRHRQAQPLHED
jgi:hypothetical protein